MMKKYLISAILALPVAGCSLSTPLNTPGYTTVQKINYVVENSYERKVTTARGPRNLFQERTRYLNDQGFSVEPDVIQKKVDAECFSSPNTQYYSASACLFAFYEKENEENYKRIKAEKESEAKAEEAKCAANPKCARDKVIQQEQERLNNVYSLIMVQNPYLQADYDQAVRMMCRKAGEIQRNGMSLEQMRKNISVVDGIAPGDRRNIQEVAESCWKLSAAGVKNGSELIGNPYQSSERMTFAY